MSGLNDNIIQERSLHIPAHATSMMSKPRRRQSIGSFKQAGHGEHWHYTCGRAYAARRRRMRLRGTGVKFALGGNTSAHGKAIIARTLAI
jgi:hypothetical protein